MFIKIYHYLDVVGLFLNDKKSSKKENYIGIKRTYHQYVLYQVNVSFELFFLSYLYK